MRRLAVFLLLVLLFCGGAQAQAYWGYVPIRPANPNQWCYKEPDCYLDPGVIQLVGNCYNGRDDLTDLGNDIRVVTEIVNPTSDRIWLTEQDAQAELEFELKTVGIKIQPPIIKPEHPYRPILHLLIYVYPLPNGYVVMPTLRLFEKDSSFQRGGPGKGEEWQVITWERQCMFFSCMGSLHCDVRRHVKQMGDQFTRKYVLQNREAQFKMKRGASSSKNSGSSSCSSCRVRW